MDIVITHEITEYACMTPEKYQYVSFSPNNKSVVISFCNKNEKVLIQTEICIKEFLKTAELIKNNIQL